MTTRRFYYKQNRLKQLRAFCHAVRTQSISKAAERMHLSQPSVSLQIKALEQEMGTVLFERRGPRIALTPEGRALYELASPLVEGIDNLPDAFAERCGNLGHRRDPHRGPASRPSSTCCRASSSGFAAEHPGGRNPAAQRHGAAKDSSGCVATASNFAVGAMFDAPGDISSTGRSSPIRPCSSRRAITL